jgi:hypothetical protein
MFAVACADGILTARSVAGGNGQRVDANQELLPLGAANLAAGVTQAFPVGASGSRTAVNDPIVGRTQLAGLVSAAVVAIVSLFLTAPVEKLPNACLGAVIVATGIGIVDPKPGERSPAPGAGTCSSRRSPSPASSSSVCWKRLSLPSCLRSSRPSHGQLVPTTPCSCSARTSEMKPFSNGMRVEMPGNPDANSAIVAIPFDVAFRPVNNDKRVVEHSAVVWSWRTSHCAPQCAQCSDTRPDRRTHRSWRSPNRPTR